MITKAGRDGNDHMPLHRRISTFAGIEHEPAIAFDAAELAPFVSARRPDLLDELLLLQRHHSAVIQSLRTFARLRLELHYGMAGLGDLSRDEKLVSTRRASVPAELARVIVAKSDELELFTTEMRPQRNAATAHSERVAQLFEEVTRAHFGPGQRPSLEPAGDDPARAAV